MRLARGWFISKKASGDPPYKETIIRIETNTLPTLKVASTSRGYTLTDDVARLPLELCQKKQAHNMLPCLRRRNTLKYF